MYNPWALAFQFAYYPVDPGRDTLSILSFQKQIDRLYQAIFEYYLA